MVPVLSAATSVCACWGEQLDTLVVGLDNLNTYYDVNIKQWRLEQLTEFGNRFVFIKGNIADKALVDKLFDEYQPQIVVNLAAQAGVRYSITNPDAYIESNLIGFYNILEACRHSYDEGREGVKHLSTLLHRACMARTKRCLTLLTTRWIIR